MQNKLNELKKIFSEELENKNTQELLETLEKELLGKTGKLKAILAGIKDLSTEEKKII
jgi:phenylalanyl-tRNA synthetase alpha subunit